MTDPRPCSPTEAVARAQRLLADPTNQVHGYQLGTGSYRPSIVNGKLIDLPWTTNDEGFLGSDCAGFACSWAYKLPRTRPGFNEGAWATVSDDINCDSAIEDAEHRQELFVEITGVPQPGDLIVYGTIPKIGSAGPWIGHVCIVLGNARATTWNPMHPSYDLLDVAQCCGGNGRMPAVIATDGSIWSHHDQMWPTHLTKVLRLVP